MQESYSHKNDVFSFGVLLHFMLTSKYPFFIFSEEDKVKVFKYEGLDTRWFYSSEGMEIYG